MATPLNPNQKKNIAPLSNAGDVAGGGMAPEGQQFSDQKGTTNFVNADKLLAANAGKGQAMLDNATANQVDTTADFTDLNDINGYDPNAYLSSSTTSASTTEKKTGTDDQGNDTTWDTTSITPTTTTKYDGMTADQAEAKKTNIDALRSKFGDLNNTFADSPSGVALRQVAQQKSVASKVPTYSAQQGGFDSFLSENEGNKQDSNGQSSIGSRRDNITKLMSKFDGIDNKTSDVKSGIATAQGKVGSVVGTATSTDSAPVITNWKDQHKEIAPAPVIATNPVTNSDGGSLALPLPILNADGSVPDVPYAPTGSSTAPVNMNGSFALPLGVSATPDGTPLTDEQKRANNNKLRKL